MGEKDITEKTLEAYGDVFADIINVLMFGGEQVICAEELEDASPVSMYKADGKVHEHERDIAKYWRSVIKLRLALFGMENQTKTDPAMTLRLFGYDGSSYRAQLLGNEKGTSADGRYYPVFTIVLYFGSGRWKQNRRLEETVTFPEGLKDRLMPFFNDYRMNLVEVAYLTEEQLKMFRSDFRVVAEYFVRSRTDPDYKPEPREIKHVDEVLKLLSVMTCDDRFEEFLTLLEEEKPKTMSEVLDRAERRGMERGLERGIEQGLERGKRETAFNLHNMGMTDDFIAQAVRESVAIVRQWLTSPIPAV